MVEDAGESVGSEVEAGGDVEEIWLHEVDGGIDVIFEGEGDFDGLIKTFEMSGVGELLGVEEDEVGGFGESSRMAECRL